MSLILAVAALFGGISSLLLLPLLVLPFNRWRFDVGPHTVEVVNYTFREVIEVDGQARGDTRVGGDGLTHAIHHVTLPSAGKLEIQVTVEGMLSPVCRAVLDGRVVFDSKPQPDLATPVPAPDADPALRAAEVLLDALACDADPRVSDAARALRDPLRAAFRRLAATRSEVEAHVALGGDGADLDAHVAARAQEADALASALRELHISANAAASDHSGALTRVREVIDRVDAEQEVATAAEVAAHRQRA